MKLIIPILFTLFLTSCSVNYELIDAYNLRNVFTLNSSPTFKGHYYQGTDSEFHYFVSKWDYKKDKYFKLRRIDLNINTPYDYKTKELRVDFFKTDKTFGSNEFYELYIIE